MYCLVMPLNTHMLELSRLTVVSSKAKKVQTGSRKKIATITMSIIHERILNYVINTSISGLTSQHSTWHCKLPLFTPSSIRLQNSKVIILSYSGNHLPKLCPLMDSFILNGSHIYIIIYSRDSYYKWLYLLKIIRQGVVNRRNKAKAQSTWKGTSVLLSDAQKYLHCFE